MLLALLAVAALFVLLQLLAIALANGPRLHRQAGEVATLDLPALTERAKTLTADAIGAVTKLGELRAKPADQRGDTYTADLRSAVDELHAVDAMHATVTRILKDAAGDERGGQTDERGRGTVAAHAQHAASAPMTVGQRVVADEAFRDFAQRGANGSVEIRTLITSGSDPSAGPAGGLFMPLGTPQLAPGAIRRRRLFVRDLLSTGTTGLNSFPYIQEKNAVTNEGGATTVLEGQPKPEVTMEFKRADAPVRKIAAWIPVTSEILADAPTVRSYIDVRLAYLLALREEDQVLNGSGTAPDLLGIRQVSGLQTVKATGGTAASTTGDRPATIATAAKQVELVDLEADGIAMNPTDFWSMVSRRTSGSGELEVNPFVSPDALRPWGLQTVRTRGLAAGTALVGAWQLGATLLDREQTVIRVGDQHSDFFTNNKVAVLAEERVALPIQRPDAFVEITFS